jgi:hypothetical protein
MKMAWKYNGCSAQEVPSLSNTAMRSAIGTKSAGPASVVLSTKLIITSLALESFQDGIGSRARDCAANATLVTNRRMFGFLAAASWEKEGGRVCDEKHSGSNCLPGWEAPLHYLHSLVCKTRLKAWVVPGSLPRTDPCLIFFGSCLGAESFSTPRAMTRSGITEFFVDAISHFTAETIGDR